MTDDGRSGTEPPGAGTIAGKRVLLAEDDASARSIIAKVLREMGLEVSEIDDGGRLLVAITS